MRARAALEGYPGGVRRVCILLLPLATGCVEKIETEMGEEGVPPEVFEVLQRSCNDQAGCHADGAGGLTFDASGSFIGQPGSSGNVAVAPGSLEESHLVTRVDAGEMPVPGTLELTAADRYVLYGWIADGAPLVEGEGAGTGMATDDGGDEASTGADATGSDTGGEVPQYDEFLPVLEIVQASCGGAACHRDGGMLPPVLDDAVAYANIVGVASSTDVPYVTAGEPAMSHILRRLNASDGFTVMPPSGALPQGDIDVIVAWIEAGANL